MADNFYQITQDIETFFVNGWRDTTPVAYQNVKFLEPANAPWVAMKVIPGLASQLGFNECVEQTGIVQVIIRIPEATTSAVANQLADSVYNIFNRKVINDIQFEITQRLLIGIVDGWYTLEVDTDFFVETHLP